MTCRSVSEAAAMTIGWSMLFPTLAVTWSSSVKRFFRSPSNVSFQSWAFVFVSDSCAAIRKRRPLAITLPCRTKRTPASRATAGSVIGRFL
jgi:hypothetical protein